MNHWNGLARVLDDGRIDLDTNIVERSIRPIVINRKKALFAGHDQCVEKWPALRRSSKLQVAQLHGVDPQTYVTDVLTKVVVCAGRPATSSRCKSDTMKE